MKIKAVIVDDFIYEEIPDIMYSADELDEDIEQIYNGEEAEGSEE